MKCSLVFAALIWSTGLSFGQDDAPFAVERGATWVVIAPAGLHLRAKPDQRAKILATAAFGDTVKTIAARHFGRDTVGQIQAWNPLKRQSYDVPIDGYWFRVLYRGKEGFMFSAYLGYGLGRVEESDVPLNRDYALLFPGENCFNNFFYRPGWHWYGLYQSESGVFTKPVQVAFYNLPHELTGEYIAADDNRDLRAIIGSRTPLPAANAVDAFIAYPYEARAGLMDQEGRLNDTLLREYHLKVVRDGSTRYWDTQQLVLQEGGVRQVLASPGLYSDGNWYLICCGDLDGDGKKDYIIWYGEKGSKTILYLSKPAAKGQHVKPVAVYYAGYCC